MLQVLSMPVHKHGAFMDILAIYYTTQVSAEIQASWQSVCACT